MHRGPQIAESTGAGGPSLPTRESPPIRVIATAGLVDHGKSTLITALTGIDPDRLDEERERGMTIDLGLARLEPPGVGDDRLVDVPGDQDAIHDMVAVLAPVDADLAVVGLHEGER